MYVRRRTSIENSAPPIQRARSMSVSGAPVNAKRIGDESCLTVPEAEAAAIYCMQQLGVSILGHQTVLLEKNNFSFITRSLFLI